MFRALVLDLLCVFFPRTFKPIRAQMARELDETLAVLRATEKASRDFLTRALEGTFPTFRHHLDQERSRLGVD